MTLVSDSATSFLEEVSDQALFDYSPELHAAIHSCPRLSSGQGISTNMMGNREIRCSPIVARPDLLTIAAIEHCSVGFWKHEWAFPEGLQTPEISLGLQSYGSLIAYAMANVGNIDAIDILKVIAGLPALMPGTPIGNLAKPGNDDKHLLIHQRSEVLAGLACLTAGSPQGYMAGLGATPLSELYSKLLGVDGRGVATFVRARAISESDLRHTIEKLFFAAMNRRSNARPLEPSEWLSSIEGALIGLAVTQSHIFLEQGADPLAVFELAQRRLRVFLGFLGTDPHLDQIARVGASAAFLVGKWRAQAPFIRTEDFAGVDFTCAMAIDGKKSLNILKLAPGLLGGPLSFFNRSEQSLPTVFDVFKCPDILAKVTQDPLLHAFDLKCLNRTASYSLRNLPEDVILAFGDTPESLRAYHRERGTHSHWVHPLVERRLGWEGWADLETYRSYFKTVVSEKMAQEPLAQEALKLFSTQHPQAYDAAFITLKQSRASRKSVESAAAYITPAMSSFAHLDETHWARALESDLSL